MFDLLPSVCSLLVSRRYFSKFRYCMFAPKVRVCRPFSDGLSSIDHLLVHPILRNSVWFVAVFTCVGNLLVIIWRSISSKEDEILSLFVQNLSGKGAGGASIDSHVSSEGGCMQGGETRHPLSGTVAAIVMRCFMFH